MADDDSVGHPIHIHARVLAETLLSGAVAEFVIARNPETESSLPFLVRLPLRSGAIVLKVRDTWPRTAKIYCHPTDVWPDDLEVVESVPVRSIERRGVAVDVVLDRARENRSQFVFTKGRGRDMVFWQSARTSRQARPSVRTPTARASGQVLEITIDTRERYAWRFVDQQASTTKAALPVGDYAVHSPAGRLLAVVERKSLNDLVSTIGGGKLWMLLAALADQPHGAVVVEDRYSQIFKLTYQRPSMISEALAEAAVRYPTVPVVFTENRALAQEWAYRFLGAALAHHHADRVGADRVAAVTTQPTVTASPKTIRAWAIDNGHQVADRGRLRPEVVAAYEDAHRP